MKSGDNTTHNLKYLHRGGRAKNEMSKSGVLPSNFRKRDLTPTRKSQVQGGGDNDFEGLGYSMTFRGESDLRNSESGLNFAPKPKVSFFTNFQSCTGPGENTGMQSVA